MGISKTQAFSADQNRMATLAKAMGNPARVAIIELLIRQETCICKDIVDELPLSQPTISQHLSELKTAGLIKGTIEGNTVCYCLDKSGFQILFNFSSAILTKLSLQDSECC